MVTWRYAKNRTSFHRSGGICRHVLNRGITRQDLFHEDDDHAPHGPEIHAATPRTPTNQSNKVECPLFRPYASSSMTGYYGKQALLKGLTESMSRHRNRPVFCFQKYVL
jgi:hypothetical protein